MATELIDAHLRSLQALDSPRHALTNPAVSQNGSVTELQILLALLFGEQIVVSEAVSFDSLGFLAAARKVLGSRPVAGRVRPLNYDPFVIACDPALIAAPPEEQYRATIVRHLGDTTFFSGSAFESINNTPQVQDVGKLVAEKRDAELQRRFHDHLDVRLFAESVSMLEDYFAVVPPVVARPPVPLQPSIDHLLSLRVDPERDENAERIQEVRELARELVEGHGLVCHRRSNLYSLVHELGWAGPVVQGLKDYVDNYYFRQIAVRTRANSAMYTPALSDPEGYGWAALTAGRRTTRQDLQWAESTAYIQLPLDAEPSASTTLIDWPAMWGILLADETVASQRRLVQALRPWPIFLDRGLEMAEEALADHIALINGKLRTYGWSAVYDSRRWIRLVHRPGRARARKVVTNALIGGLSGTATAAVETAFPTFAELGGFGVFFGVLLNADAIQSAIETALEPVHDLMGGRLSRGSFARFMGPGALRLPPRSGSVGPP